MRKQKAKRTMMGISMLAVMGITLLTPSAGLNEVNATSTPSDATSTSSDMEIVTAPAASPVTIDSTNFPDTAFREWVALNCDKNSDGQLSDDEISQCTIINVAGKGIASLQGIEYFSNLRELNCCNNNLSSLDVSNNTALTRLECASNDISSLDVSNNTALTYLRCNYNDISSLDVSNNTALTYLSCSFNDISSLDVSNNTALTELFCDFNDISSLDVSNNTALTDLHCNYNQLTSLDVSKNIYLTMTSELWSSPQFISVPMYKNGDEYYFDLSEFPINRERVSIDATWMTKDGTTYNSTSGRINLSEPKDVDDTVRYLYDTNGPDSLSYRKMTVILEISEIRDIADSTTEEPTTEESTTEQPITEQPTTEQPTTEQLAVVVPPTAQTGNDKDPAPKTGDTTPIYPVIFLLLASFTGGMTLYIRRKRS